MRVKVRLTITGVSRWRVSLLQPEPQRGDAEKREETDHVGDGGDEGAGCHCRIGTDPLQYHRDQDAAERAGDEVADDGKADHAAEAGDLEPGHGGNARDPGKSK